MKNKIIAIFVLAALILPSMSQALLMIPTANITIIVNTQGEDGAFNFTLTNSEEFSLQTENLTASQSISVVAFGDRYFLTQDNVSGLKIKDINCVSDNPANVFSYTLDSAIFSPAVDENITCTFNNEKTKTPVLIVPGLVGTELAKGNELLWADIPRMVNPFNSDSFMDPLAFNENNIPVTSDISTLGVIRSKNLGPFLFDHTDSLIDDLLAQGYIENETLFTFPYDWRYGASGKNADGKTNSDLLGEKIQSIMTQTGSDKVDVVAHSQGGLVVKKYVAEHQADHHIGKAVFVGVPSTGAPESVKVLLQGANFGIPWLSEAEIKKISANIPAAYDLLPSQKYYDVKGSFVKVIDQGDLLNFFDTTQKNLTYEEFGDFLTDGHGLNSQGLAGAENLHTQAFDDFDLRTAGVDLYAIDGCKAGTLGKIIESRQKDIFGQSFIDYKTPEFVPGDGTVPLESATNLPIDQDHKFYSLTGEHSKMMSQDGSRQKIVNIISGSTLATGDKITQDITECELNGKAISVFSPIDILVTDQLGNKMGNAQDGSVLSEIPNATFEVMSEHKFLYLPDSDGQTYDIQIDGTGTGTYTITSQDITNSEVIGTEVFSNLSVTPDLTGQINLGDSTTLTVVEHSGGQPETILPSAILDAQDSEDYVPPVSGVTLAGTVGQAGFYKTNVNVLLNTADDESGVLALNYNVDGTAYQKVLVDSASINITQEGSHAVSFFGTDKAGNNEQEQTVNFVIDKTVPEFTVEFDPVTKDLKFLAQESGIVVADNDDKVIFTDKAGNVTEITLKDKDRKKGMKAEIKSLKYNGATVDITKNVMKYSWKLDNNKNLKELTQHVKSKKEYNVVAEFDGKKTKITGKDAGGQISESFNGLKIIKIITNKGDFGWSY